MASWSNVISTREYEREGMVPGQIIDLLNVDFSVTLLTRANIKFV